MKVRSAAARVLAKLLNQQGSLSSLLPEAARSVPAKDHALLQELCFGCCRWQPRLQCYLDLLLDKPLRNKDLDVHALLLLGLYQLIYTRVPDHAAISATVEAARALKKPWATRLINGVLRGYQRGAEQLNAQLAGRAEFVTAHPKWFVDAVNAAWPSRADALLAASNAHPPLTLRVNRLRISREDYLVRLQESGIEAQATALSTSGITLAKPMDVYQLPGFNDGLVSVQDEAPQLCAPLLELHNDQLILDACCAPGGKTAHILESLGTSDGNDNGKVVAVDLSEQRLQRSKETLDRLGLKAELIAGDASRPQDWWQGPLFDRILVDAPCSATGVIRRNPDIKLLREAADIERLASIQLAILTNIWNLLKPGGQLLYATCSVLPQENVRIVEAFVNKTDNVEHLPIDANWGIEQSFGRQLLPRIDGNDGFYFARLRKKL